MMSSDAPNINSQRDRPESRTREAAANADQITRLLATARGQLRAVSEMVEDDRDCLSVLHQLSAVQGELDRVRREVLTAHLHDRLIDVPADQAADITDDLIAAVYGGSSPMNDPRGKRPRDHRPM